MNKIENKVDKRDESETTTSKRREKSERVQFALLQSNNDQVYVRNESATVIIMIKIMDIFREERNQNRKKKCK